MGYSVTMQCSNGFVSSFLQSFVSHFTVEGNLNTVILIDRTISVADNGIAGNNLIPYTSIQILSTADITIVIVVTLMIGTLANTSTELIIAGVANNLPSITGIDQK